LVFGVLPIVATPGVSLKEKGFSKRIPIRVGLLGKEALKK